MEGRNDCLGILKKGQRVEYKKEYLAEENERKRGRTVLGVEEVQEEAKEEKRDTYETNESGRKEG